MVSLSRYGTEINGNAYKLLLLGLVSQARGTQRSRGLPHIVQSFLDPLNILESKFRLNDLHVTDGVDISFHVGDFVVVEGTNDLEDTVNSTNMRQKSISETSSGRCTL